MANYKIFLLPVVALMALSGCVEPVDPQFNVPDVKTSERVVSVSLHQAQIEAAPADYSYVQRYLEIDIEGNFQNPRRINQLQGDTLWIVSGLDAGTHYLYREGATDGLISRYGPVCEFQTLPAVEVSGFSLSVWDQTGTPVAVDDTLTFGFFYTDATTGKDEQDMSNLPFNYDPVSQRWSMPVEIEPTSVPHTFYVYSPYDDRLKSKDGISVSSHDDVDVLYGKSDDITLDNYRAAISMKHAKAKIRFSVTRDSKDNVGASFKSYGIEQSDAQLPSYGTFDIVTEQLQITAWTNQLERWKSFTPTETATVLELYVLPCNVQSKQFFLTNTDGSTYYVDIPDGAWEAGNEYTYPVSVRLNQLEIGDVTITPWNEVGSGSVIIYN